MPSGPDKLIKIQAEIIYAGLGNSAYKDSGDIVRVIKQHGSEQVLHWLGETKRILDNGGMLDPTTSRPLDFAATFAFLVQQKPPNQSSRA